MKPVKEIGQTKMLTLIKIHKAQIKARCENAAGKSLWQKKRLYITADEATMTPIKKYMPQNPILIF